MKDGDSIIIKCNATYTITITISRGYESNDNAKYYLSGGKIGDLLKIIDLNSYVNKFGCCLIATTYIASSSLENLTNLCEDLIKLNKFFNIM